MSTFTPRQCDVLRLVAQGFTIKQIAEKLGISEGCAKDHFDHAKDRIPLPKGARNRVIVVNWIRENLNGELTHPGGGKTRGTTKSNRSKVVS